MVDWLHASVCLCYFLNLLSVISLLNLECQVKGTSVLFALPLHPESEWRDSLFWGQTVLHGLVECTDHREVLELLEHPRSSLGLQVGGGVVWDGPRSVMKLECF